MTIDIIKKAKTIFWDFDGVIKESVKVKSDAFEKLFSPFGSRLAKKVREHHEKNGGVSRYEKFPIYLNWVGEHITKEKLDYYEKSFSSLVKKKVIDSPWVEGAKEYLQQYYTKQLFFLVTATPQLEIEEILKQLDISHFFKTVIGSPTKKKDALKKLIIKYQIDIKDAIMLGDSFSDFDAAKFNNIEFVLRKTDMNKKLQLFNMHQSLENLNG